MRVAKEGIFSGLNNVVVYSTLEPDFSTAFGFTEAEVDAVIAAVSPAVPSSTTGATGDVRDAVRRWYDGYSFGGTIVYNPWSVLSFAERPHLGPVPHWVGTSADDVLRALILERGRTVLDEFETLLSGGVLKKPILEQLALRDLLEQPMAVWSLLLYSGYLTARSVERTPRECLVALAIPNLDVHYAFRGSVLAWAEWGPSGGARLRTVSEAMLAGDVETFAVVLSDLVVRTLPFHDLGGAAPERVYQAFVLGLLVYLSSDYEVRSNRESDYGRLDVLVAPRRPGAPGAILELKRVAEGESVDEALAGAAAQIPRQRYAEELVDRGATETFCYAVVFDGKRCWVRRA